MRHILPGAVLTTFAIAALSRYLPPEIYANAPQTRDKTALPLITSAAALSPADAPTFLSLSSLSLRSVIGEGHGNTDGVVTTQSLGESANDILWFKHVDKGKSLMCAMSKTDVTAGWQAFDTRKPPSAASKWVNFNDMAAWYWFEGKFGPAICEMGTYWGMRTTFQALKVNPKSNKYGNGLQCFMLQHQNENARYPDGKPRPAPDQSYTVDGKFYHPTNAAHFFAMDVRAGAIVGIALVGPDIAWKRMMGWDPTDDELPRLRQLSDLYWLYWRSLNTVAGTRVDNLRTYIVYGIHNAATVEIIARVLRNRGRNAYEPWPGQYFASDSTEGQALLGSPIGATIGFLLMQHKKELGNKYVSGVRVLRNDGVEGDTHEEVDLVFHIEEVPPEKEITDEPMDVDSPQGAAGTNALAVANLALRRAAAYPVEEQVLGSNNVLWVHRVAAR